MSQTRPCDQCGYSFHISQQLCPHCAWPALYGNVFAAEDTDEAAALQQRYKEAKREAQVRGAGALHVVENFEAEISNTHAVIARSFEEVQRLSTSDNEIYASFTG